MIIGSSGRAATGNRTTRSELRAIPSEGAPTMTNIRARSARSTECSRRDALRDHCQTAVLTGWFGRAVSGGVRAAFPPAGRRSTNFQLGKLTFPRLVRVKTDVPAAAVSGWVLPLD